MIKRFAIATLFVISCFPPMLSPSLILAQPTRTIVNSKSQKLTGVEKAQLQVLIKSFRALKSQLTVGINYRDYSAELRKLNIDLDIASDSKPISGTLAYSNLKNAFEHYLVGQKFWQELNITPTSKRGFVFAETDYIQALVHNYGLEESTGLGYKHVYGPEVLSIIWGEAYKSTLKAKDWIESQKSMV